MRLPRRDTTLPLLMWLGLFGAPVAWVAQFGIGVAATILACGRGARDVPLDPLNTVATAAGGAIAVLGLAAATVAFMATRGMGEAPPAGRVHFLATIGIVIAPLFLAIILMSGITSVEYPSCHQS